MVLLLLGCAARPPEAPVPPPARLAAVVFPGDARLVAIARDVIEVRIALAPNLAAEAGLLDDAVRVPTYAPAAVAGMVARLERDLAALDALPLADLSVREQVDARWVRANAEEARHRLVVERRWTHRPAEWLEPVANSMVAFATLAPGRAELLPALGAQVPGMLDEMRREVVAPTRRDVETALPLLDGMDAMLGGSEPVRAYRAELAALAELPDYRVIGADAYAWRLERALLLPWTPDALLALAERELAVTDARIAEVAARVGEPAPATDAERAAAAALDRDGLMRLYEGVVADNLADLRAMGVLTVPDDLVALRARETPDAIVPFTGDGGSMNPPTLFGPPSLGWWNVEHFRAEWTPEERLETVMGHWRHDETGMGPYSVHEGVPGHHLQLAMARANPDPIRTLLADTPAIEGWALYAEQLFWEGGGMGDSARAELNVLNSYRGRIRRVVYDVNVETGRWTLQEAADWRAGKSPGPIGPELLRTVQWPTQLVAYFAGKQQILALREEMRARPGYTDRAFHDALLAAGPIPLSLVRAEMLGEPIPR